MKILSLLLTLLLVTNLSAAEKKEWTLLFYINGDNNLDPHMQMALKRIDRAGADRNVNTLVMFDGQKDGDSLMYSYKGNSRQIIEDNIEYDMGSPKTIASFVQMAKEKFPASRYALIIYTHGRGILNLPVGDGATFGKQTEDVDSLVISPDDQSGSFLDEQEMVAELTPILAGQKLDLLVFDSCLMGNTGIALTFSSIAKKMIASEYLIALYKTGLTSLNIKDGIGIDLEELIETVIENPKGSVDSIAKSVVDTFYDAYKSGMFNTSNLSAPRKIPSILSYYDLEQTNVLKDLLKNLADDYMDYIKGNPSYIDDLYAELLTIRMVGGIGYIDLGVLADMIYRVMGLDSARELSQYLYSSKELVRYSRDVHIDYSPTGLSIFFPVMSLVEEEYWPLVSFYSGLEFEQEIGWSRLIRAFTRDYYPRIFEMRMKLLQRYLDGENVQVMAGNPTAEENEHELLSMIMWSQFFEDLRVRKYGNIEETVEVVSVATVDSDKFIQYKKSLVQLLRNALKKSDDESEKRFYNRMIQELL